MWGAAENNWDIKTNTKPNSKNAGQRVPPFNMECRTRDFAMPNKLCNRQLCPRLVLPISFLTTIFPFVLPERFVNKSAQAPLE